MANSNIFLPFLSAFDPKGIKEAERQLAAFSGSIKNFARSVISAFGGVSATVASVNFVRGAITQSRDLERQTAALGSIFGATSERMMNFSKNGVQMGLSTADAAKAATFLGSVLKSAGFEMEDVATNTEKLVGLASDLAATYGYDVSEALTGMTALFRGEYDPIEKFGVAMKQSEVNTILAARSQKNLTGQELLHAQQLIRLELLMQRTADAQGAFTRQGDSLFVQQSKLSALWENMQATIGAKLTPTLAAFLKRLQPIVENFAPHLERIFASFGALIEAMIPKLGTFADKMGNLFDTISDVFTGANPLLKGFLDLLVDNIDSIIVFVAIFKSLKSIINVTVAAIEIYTVAVKAATGAQAGLTVAQMATPFGLLAVAIAGLATSFYIYANYVDHSVTAMDKLKNKMLEAGRAATTANPALQKYLRTQLAIAGYGDTDETAKWLSMRTQNKASQDFINLGGGEGGAGKTATKVKTFFDDLVEEMKKQALRLKLSGLGVSEALVDAILGSSAWEASAKKIIAGGTVTADYVQRQFNKTKAGLDEIAKAAEAAAQASAKAAEEAAEVIAKATEEAAQKLREYNEAIKTAAKLTQEIADILKNPAIYTGVVATLGAFEQGVVSTFDSIRSKIQDATDSGQILSGAAESLRAYADSTEASLRAIAKQRDALANQIDLAKQAIANADQLRKANSDLISSFKNLYALTPQIGKFEQSVVSSFANIFEQIDSAVADGIILKRAGSRITDFANTTMNAMRAIARQRDILAEKINIAKSVYSGVMNLANITSFLETTTQSITETTTRIISGIQVATTKTFELVTSGGLINNFQKLVDKTKAFAKNLLELKQMGLNKSLFAQLVNAGADAGGATAQAIVDGGVDTVSALNDLYNQLGVSAETITAGVTETMYEVGQGIINSGFIKGLLSQEAALAEASLELATDFGSAFGQMMSEAINENLPDIASLIDQFESLKNQAKALADAFAATFADALAKAIADALAKTYGGNTSAVNPFQFKPDFQTNPSFAPEIFTGASPADFAQTASGGTKIDLTVNAGLGTDAATVGQEIVSVIKQYERRNGSVWVTA